MKKILLRYGIPFLICSILAITIMAMKNVFTEKDAKTISKILTDSFFASGTLMLCIGILIFSSNQGTFDIIVYGFAKMTSFFRRDLTKIKFKTFYEYREAKKEKKTSSKNLILVGLSFIIISLFFLIPYYA